VAATVASRLRRAARRLSRDVDALRFAPPVTHVYNPLDYAWRPHARYLERYGATRKRVLFVGMNPGPFGMSQTGVPFGEVGWVRDFLGIEEPVGRPAREHPKRPIEGFACERREVSGQRVWGAIRDHFGSADSFSEFALILSYCPLVFMEEGGRNRTPDKLAPTERESLYAACDRHLRSAVRILEPEWVVGIGAFAEGRARAALGDRAPRLGGILHPSPASPLANRGWAPQARAQLREQGVCPLGEWENFR
jgi:single-strand selective monofunctional uracil DNA glycosylase